MSVAFSFLPMKRTAPTAWLLQFAFGMCSRSLPSMRPRGQSRRSACFHQQKPTCRLSRSSNLQPRSQTNSHSRCIPLCIGWGNRQACLSNKCRSSQHHLEIGLRLVTRSIHGRICMQSSIPKQQHNRKKKRSRVGVTQTRVTISPCTT